MSLQTVMRASLIIPLCVGTIEYQRNISCSDVQTDNGFNFSHECPVGSEISASYNKTQIAVAMPGKKPDYSPEVISMDDRSVVTRECRDLNVKCVSFGQHVKETWVFFKVIGEIKNPGLQTPWSLIVVLAGMLVFIGWLVWCFMSWKKEMIMQHRAATVPGFFTHLCHSCCCREGKSKGELPETADTSMVEIPSATEPHGSGENDTEQVATLEAVEVHSIDSKPDGKTPHTNSLDHNLNTEGIQPTENGDISAPDDNRAAHHRAMNRNLRDDPGGRDWVMNTEIHSGCVRGDHGPDDHEAEGESLLWNERANIQGPDMTSEAIALVNKCGFGPDQVSGHFDAPNTDVESMPKMKNHCTDKY
ncbi:uncharacterized protein [Trachinotus anak]|uniref:uncharacterized protein n=1 Tax=Trachinotus anak TaxID=443729 RepID=UPI0039F259A5